ncbi:hypothetical protein M3629_03560 [Paenibacillus polysaccharolyticus]|uniref:hypothetical protein n=1 Tax=Paenibacillus polysaccharolyticus TaxID=582692 RepID=UPI00203A9847|nr:hypothetical protein [Paenibacillus polysaccharolyticus]MCM3131844.1 hypothetical protein [Paenibacillus polysaccharolyticus]
MATQVHACLVGNWVNLTDDPDCKMGKHKTSPFIWWEENADIYSPFKRAKENTMYQQDYVNIHYKCADYRIHPMFIQIVST